MNMFQYHYNNPEAFWLFLLFIPMIVWYIWKGIHVEASIQVSSIKNLANLGSFLVYARHLLIVLFLVGLSFLIVAIARPQVISSSSESEHEGIDIMLALDISSSMLAEDFSPNRIEAAKHTSISFIQSRPSDRIGISVFAGESFIQCPLTVNHQYLINIFSQIKMGVLNDGTAIGMGLLTAINTLKESDAKSKVIILLTDGENNAGSVDPITVASIAYSYNIRIYTIGVGTIGTARVPVYDQSGNPAGMRDVEVRIDEPLLKEVANKTEGKYFRATGNQVLDDIYKEIDVLEKTKIDVSHYTKKEEKYPFFMIISLVSLVLGFLLKVSLFRSLP